MCFIKKLENEVISAFNSCGYDTKSINICTSNRPDLGEYQVNDAMRLAKINHVNPFLIAQDVVKVLSNNDKFKDVNNAGGFINFSLSNSYLSECMNSMIIDVYNNIPKMDKKTIFMDYGGANVAKMLHVGHLRSANIGEALKRLAKLVGHNVISDAHLGDSGLQAGIVCLQMKMLYPSLACFQDGYDGEDFELPISVEDLSVIYPEGSKRSKEDDDFKKEAHNITYLIQKGDICYSKLWEKISLLSMRDINHIYQRLNTSFELWEGEKDSFAYIPDMLDMLDKKGFLYQSDGAVVMDVKNDDDEKEVPPIILVKSDGAYLYGTTDLATIYGRNKRFKFDEIWYVVDNRQQLHFTQVFRAAYKSNIVSNEQTLSFLGFGTMNGQDGKPFKTRDGGNMSLVELIDIVKFEVRSRLNNSIVLENEKDAIAEDLAIGAIKYADLLPYRGTDYVFEPSKFVDVEGKTGPYILYSTIRMRSLLTKAGDNNYHISDIYNEYDREVFVNLMNLSSVLSKSYEAKSLNEIAEYLYKLTSSYNKFYEHNHILSESDMDKKESWISLTFLVLKINLLLLDVLGIKCPNKM